MVRKVTLPVYRHFSDYVRAFHDFSHNARSYLLFAFLQTMGASMIGCVFALYMRASGMSTTSFGYVEGAIALATALVALVGPALVASLGYRALMLISLGMLIASRLAQSMLPMATALIALGAVVGLGDGFLRTVNSAFLSEHSTHEERTQLFSMEFLLRMLGVFLGGVTGGLLPSLIGGEPVVGYQWTMMVGAAVMTAGMLPMARIKEKVHGVRGFWRVTLQTGRDFSAWSHLTRLAVPQSFLVFAGAMTAPFVPLYLKDVLGATVQQIGLIQGSGALVVGFAAFATPVIRRRLGVGRGVTLLQVLAIPFLMMVPHIGGLLTGVLLLFVRSTLMGAGAPLYSELSMESVRAQDKPLVGGGLLFVLSIVTFAGNILGGRLMEVSYTAPYVPAALVYAVGTAVTWVVWVYLPKRKEAALAEPAFHAVPEAA